jgi:hypothetical protein
MGAFKAGDKVRVKKKAECSRIDERPRWIAEMDVTEGVQGVVDFIYDEEIVTVKILDDFWLYHKSWLEPVEDDKPAAIASDETPASDTAKDLFRQIALHMNEISNLLGCEFCFELRPTATAETEPAKAKEPEWREPGPWDVGNPTAQFRDVDYEMWRDDFGCWRGTFFCDDGTLIHISGDSGVTWKQARVKDHGPHVAPKSSN